MVWRCFENSSTESAGFDGPYPNIVEATPLSHSASSNEGLVDEENSQQRFGKFFGSQDDLSTIKKRKTQSCGYFDDSMLTGLPIAFSLAALAYKVGKWALGKGVW